MFQVRIAEKYINNNKVAEAIWKLVSQCHSQHLCFTTTFSQQDPKTPRDICQAAVSKSLHLAKTCSKERQTRKACTRRPKGRRRSGLAHRAGPKCAARWAWHSEEECFQTVKRNRKKEGEKKRGREKGRNESWGDMCLTLRNSSGSNLHIYDRSPEWAHCERRTTTTESKNILKNLQKMRLNAQTKQAGGAVVILLNIC